MSLWREQYVAHVMVAGILLEAMNYYDLSEQLSHLSYVCKDSKRKRLHQMCFFSSA